MTIVKSGTDFREFSCIRLEFNTSGDLQGITVERVEVTREFAPDPVVMQLVAEQLGMLIKRCIDHSAMIIFHSREK